MWALGMEPQSSRRAAIGLKPTAISPTSPSSLKYLLLYKIVRVWGARIANQVNLILTACVLYGHVLRQYIDWTQWLRFEITATWETNEAGRWQIQGLPGLYRNSRNWMRSCLETTKIQKGSGDIAQTEGRRSLSSIEAPWVLEKKKELERLHHIWPCISVAMCQF